jgi:uncharacterized phage-associated protein
MTRLQKKSLQAIVYLANKNDEKKITRLELMKLLWLADKYHLLKYGRTITNNTYYAMKDGPVPSESMNLSRKVLSSEINKCIEVVDYEISAKTEPELKYFSESDLEVLDFIWNKFGDKDVWELRDLTHEYPEWKRFEEDLKDPTSPKSYVMEMVDFFNIPEPTNTNEAQIFKNIPDGMLYESKQTFNLRRKYERPTN